MWNWLRKKLGIVDYTDELINLNAKVYEVIRITSECLHQMEQGQIGNNDRLVLKSMEDRLNKQLNEINHSIKTIPKEMVIKNVLSI